MEETAFGPGPGLPAWIRKRDGRLEPFDADRICQSLFAATEHLRRPDLFLARELTDGVLHFLARENAGDTPTSQAVGELTVKVVRELRQPALAHAYDAWLEQRQQERQTRADGTQPLAPVPEISFRFSPAQAPIDIQRELLRTYSLHAIFSPDLVAAQREGLLTLHGLEAPAQIARCAADTSAPSNVADAGQGTIIERLLEANSVAGDLLVLDSPERLAWAGTGRDAAAALLHAVRVAGRATGKSIHINLNCAAPPSWATELSGPLFAESSRQSEVDTRDALRDDLLESFANHALSQLPATVDWHVSERDFASTTRRRWLVQMARAAVEGSSVTFAFDRPRSPVALGPGLDRQHSAVLMIVSIPLARLVDWPGVRGDADMFLKKLVSLARLARSAAMQKRHYLRRQRTDNQSADLGRGFLLERARLLVMPIGLAEAAQAMAGADSGSRFEFSRRVLQAVREVLRQEGRANLLDVCVDGSRKLVFGPDRDPVSADLGATPKQQLRAAGTLHADAGDGTAFVSLSSLEPPGADELFDLLLYSWRQTEIARLRFVPHQRSEPLALL
jgi:hypothetical protein